MTTLKDCKYLSNECVEIFKGICNNNLSKDDNKLLIYMLCKAHRNEYSQYSEYELLRTLKENNTKLSKDEIIAQYSTYADCKANVSEKCKVMKDVVELKKTFSSLNALYTPPKYDMKCDKIHNYVSDTPPNKTIIWELNNINPELSGMFIENMIAYVLEIYDNCSDISEYINYDLTFDNIKSILKDGLVHSYHINDLKCENNTLLINNKILNHEHFLSPLHYILFMSLLHFTRNTRSFGTHYINMLNILRFINEKVDELHKYIKQLSNLRLFKDLKCMKFKHSFKPKSMLCLKGEMDFVSDDCIIDVKVYKQPAYDEWFYQLYLYNVLMNDGKNRTLQILDMFNNEIVTYKIVNDNINNQCNNNNQHYMYADDNDHVSAYI